MENETKNELITEGEEKIDNELIADFMEFPYKRTGLTFSEPRVLFVSKAKMEYHTSWDWLMPVVDKIERLGNRCEIGITKCKIYSADYNRETFYAATKILAVYEHVVDFIKWYNETQSRGGGN